MALIHKTTMTPGKLELLAAWLPSQPWYAGTEGEPQLDKAGGFRLDDPAGEVGIEFMVVTDRSGDRPVAYHVPLTYRGAPLDGADTALVGTSEHGILGRRWVYDGIHDPVLVDRLLALVQGRAEPQAQSLSDTPDPSVIGSFAGTALPDPGPDPGTGPFAEAVASAAVTHGPDTTDLDLRYAGRHLVVRVVRVLRPEGQGSGTGPAGALGRVTAGWRWPDGAESRAPLVVVVA